MVRKQWPADVEEQILISCKRICALCLHFRGDIGIKKGQIAHIDRDHSNSVIQNGAFLCKDHHDEYDTLSHQSKRLTPGELRHAVAQVHEYVQAGGRPKVANSSLRLAKRRRNVVGVGIDVYNRRLPIYQRTIEFVREVAKDLRPTFQTILQFGRDTEEALFLFDDSIAEYLEDLSTKAFRLHFLNTRREGMVSDDREMPDF